MISPIPCSVLARDHDLVGRRQGEGDRDLGPDGDEVVVENGSIRQLDRIASQAIPAMLEHGLRRERPPWTYVVARHGASVAVPSDGPLRETDLIRGPDLACRCAR